MNKNSFFVENNSLCNLKNMKIYVNEKIVWSGFIKIGEKIYGNFYPYKEGFFDMEMRCDAGDIRIEKVGYIRMWQAFDHKIVIGADKLVYYEILNSPIDN